MEDMMLKSPSAKLKHLRRLENDLYVIHYSCQTLGDGNEGLSPRITSIAVLHVATSSMHSFSIHLVAEIKRISKDAISDHYDEIECEMLGAFYDFVKSVPTALWLHWNMDNVNYGFALLEHRFKVLAQKEAPQIPDSKRFNLSALIIEAYGPKCVDHPRMENLMNLNGGKHRDFLGGQEEADSFARKEYVRLHKSTMCKAYWFKSMYHKLQSNKIITTRSNWRERVIVFSEKPLIKILGIVGIFFTIFQLFHAIFKITIPNKPASSSPAAPQVIVDTDKISGESK